VTNRWWHFLTNRAFSDQEVVTPGPLRLGVSGPALSFEIERREVRNLHPFFEALAFGLLRAASFAAAGWLAKDAWFGNNFGILSAIGLVATYLIVGPPLLDSSSRRPRMTKPCSSALSFAVHQ
jgi:hypothetical protein